jgi:hypothetical protein
MSLRGTLALTARRQGLLFAALAGLIAAGLIPLIPRSVVALSETIELGLRAAVLGDGVGAGGWNMLLLLAMPTLYQLLLAVAVIWSYGAGLKGHPEGDRHPGLERAALGLALALALVATLLRPSPWTDLPLLVAIPALAFGVGRLLRLARPRCGFGAHTTLAFGAGFVATLALVYVL